MTVVQEKSSEEVFGIDPALLNDDRLGPALDAIAPELDHIIGTVGARRRSPRSGSTPPACTGT